MPAFAVYKTRTAEYLDKFYGECTDLASTLRQAQDLMADHPDALAGTTDDLVRDQVLLPDSADRFRDGWLDGSAPPEFAVERVLRLAYREALKIALSSDPPRPLEMLWVYGAGSGFEAHICEGSRAVTVVVATSAEREYGSRYAGAGAWAIRAAVDGDVGERLDDGPPPVVKIQTSGKAQ
jgi:hypothetical protein